MLDMKARDEWALIWGVTLSRKGGSQGDHEKGGSQGVHEKGVHKKGRSREPHEPPWLRA